MLEADKGSAMVSLEPTVNAKPFLHGPVLVKPEMEEMLPVLDQACSLAADLPAKVLQLTDGSSFTRPYSAGPAKKEMDANLKWDNINSFDDSLLSSPVSIKPKMHDSVYIPRQLILKQVMENLKLKVHAKGYDSTLKGLSMDTAWMDVDLPCGNKPGADSTTIIFGAPKPSRAEADESACEAVLNYYCSARDVSIDDFSRIVLKTKQEKLEASNFFCATMQDRVVRLVMERDAALDILEKHNKNTGVKMQPLSEIVIKKKKDDLNNDCFYEILQDKITNLLQDRNLQNKRYSSLVHDMISICDSFGDLLPLKKITTDQGTSEDAETGFIFAGSKKNPSRIDELALALLKILRDGIIYETKHNTTQY